MIEKLDIIKDSENCVDAFGDTHNVAGHKVINKINELVDAVNGILDYAPLEMAMKAEPKPADPYAEQRNYDVFVKNRHLIGKLCKFKFGTGYTYGILTNIKRKPSQWAFESNGRAFSSCEPVKPTDSIIYKGTDND